MVLFRSFHQCRMDCVCVRLLSIHRPNYLFSELLKDAPLKVQKFCRYFLKNFIAVKTKTLLQQMLPHLPMTLSALFKTC